MRATADGVVARRLLVAKRHFKLWRRWRRGPGRIRTELWVLGLAVHNLVDFCAFSARHTLARSGRWSLGS